MNRYALGRKGPDNDRKRFAAFRPTASVHHIADETSYEWMLPHDPYDQEQRGACVTFMAKTIVESGLKKHHGISLDISARALYEMTEAFYEQQNLGQDGGLYAQDALATLRDHGYVRSADWPYDVADADFFAPVPPPLVRTDERLKSFVRVTGDEDPAPVRFQKICVAISEAGMLGLGMTWPNDWFNCGADRKLIANPTQGVAGGHEVTAVAYSLSRRFVTIRCAWPGWGDRGYAEIPFDVDEQFAPSDVYALTGP